MAARLSLYNPYTGYTYACSEHAKERMYERFSKNGKEVNIEKEFKTFHHFITRPVVDDEVIANLNVGEEAVIKNCSDKKVYVVTIADNGEKGLDVLLKTVLLDNGIKQYTPRKGQTLYRVYKDGTLHKWRHLDKK